MDPDGDSARNRRTPGPGASGGPDADAGDASTTADGLDDPDAVTITVCAAGPLLVRGPVTLFDDAGEPVTAGRKTIALCRCGGSSAKPFCDGTHKRRKEWAALHGKAPKAGRGGGTDDAD